MPIIRRAQPADPVYSEMSVSPLTPLGFAAAVFRNWLIIAGVSVVIGAIGVASVTLRPPPYTATSVFRPETDQPGRFSGFAAQLGIGGGNLNSESVDFYARLLRSTDLLKEAASKQYVTAQSSRPVTLQQLWGAAGSDQERTWAAVRRLDRATRVTTDWDAGVVVLQTAAAEAALAEQVNRQLLDLVNDFNIRKRMTRASQERRFIDSRLAEAKSELNATERGLERFLQQNRTYANSPQLMIEYEGIYRQFQLQQQTHASLAQALEQARIEEVRNTPIVTVLQSPEGTASQGGRGLRVMMFITFGLFAGLGIALVRETLRFTRLTRPDEYAALTTAVRDVIPSIFRFRLPARTSRL